MFVLWASGCLLASIRTGLLGTPGAPREVDREGYDGNLHAHGRVARQQHLAQRDQAAPLERCESCGRMTLIVAGGDALESFDLNLRTTFSTAGCRAFVDMTVSPRAGYMDHFAISRLDDRGEGIGLCCHCSDSHKLCSGRRSPDILRPVSRGFRATCSLVSCRRATSTATV